MNKFQYNTTKLKSPSFKNKSNSDDDEEVTFGKQNQLGYFTQQKTSTCIVVPIDEPVKDAEYYRQVTQAISNAGSDDTIQFEINSPGGNLGGLLALLTSMAKTNATTIANINAECHSAASMLALNCDNVFVSPYASMLVHFVTFGTYGKATDIKSHVNHIHSTTERLFRETYEFFLNEDEIEKCINGLELWLDYDEIVKRLEYKYAQINKIQEEVEELEEKLAQKIKEESEKPKRSRKSKAKPSSTEE